MGPVIQKEEERPKTHAGSREEETGFFAPGSAGASRCSSPTVLPGKRELSSLKGVGLREGKITHRGKAKRSSREFYQNFYAWVTRGTQKSAAGAVGCDWEGGGIKF